MSKTELLVAPVKKIFNSPKVLVLLTVTLLLSYSFISFLEVPSESYPTAIKIGAICTYISSLILILSNGPWLQRIIFIIPALLYTLELYLNSTSEIPPGTRNNPLYLCIIFNTAILGAVLSYISNIFEIQNNKVKLGLTGTILLLTLIVGSGIFVENWFDPKKNLAVIPLFRDFMILFACIYWLIMFAFIPPFNYQLKNPIEALKLRFKSTKRPFLDTGSFILITSITILSLILKLSRYDSIDFTKAEIQFLDLSALYFLFPAIYIVINFKIEFRTNKLANSLIKSIDSRLIERASTGKSNITTLSFPSFIYTIDNDPGSDLVNSLPATIVLIRNEEFKRCLNSLLQKTSVNELHLGSRYFGAVNPEKTPISSLEILSVFANLHLKAVPLIERRILGLCHLLPVVDPELAQKSEPDNVGRRLRAQGNFMFLDFNWVDQHLSKSLNLSSYGTSFEPLPGHLREAINKQEQNHLGKGTVIWLTKRAAIQIKKEIPSIARLISEHPVQVETRGLELLFIIKIEDLIPVLTNYEVIESGKQILSDYEPSSDAVKLTEIIKRRIGLARTHKEIQHVIDAVLSYQWYGYSEKDMALELLLSLWNEKIKGLETPNPESFKKLKDSITEGIFAVGYPSKHFHEAQLEKQALRNIETISSVAIEPSNPQFNEAWILLAGGISGRMTNEDLPKILSILSYAIKTDRIFSSSLVQMKLLDSLIFLIPSVDSSSKQQIEDMLKLYLKALKSKKISHSQVIQIADRVDYMVDTLEWDDISSDIFDLIIVLFETYEKSSSENVSQFKMKIKSKQKTAEVEGW